MYNVFNPQSGANQRLPKENNYAVPVRPIKST